MYFFHVITLIFYMKMRVYLFSVISLNYQYFTIRLHESCTSCKDVDLSV